MLQRTSWLGAAGSACKEMCAEMVREDLKVAQRHALLKEHGFDIPVSVEN